VRDSHSCNNYVDRILDSDLADRLERSTENVDRVGAEAEAETHVDPGECEGHILEEACQKNKRVVHGRGEDDTGASKVDLDDVENPSGDIF